jgi:integrase/recombinase XerD
MAGPGAAEWLRIWADLGRAPRTIDAYARGLAEYLQVCERDGVDPVAATRAQVAGFVRELTSRPSRRGPNVVALDSGAGLANATLQQRLVPVRLFYDFLMEEGLRESNPVGRGSYTPGRRFGGGHGGRRWSRGWSSCRGSRPRPSGCGCWRCSGVSRPVTG